MVIPPALQAIEKSRESELRSAAVVELPGEQEHLHAGRDDVELPSSPSDLTLDDHVFHRAAVVADQRAGEIGLLRVGLLHPQGLGGQVPLRIEIDQEDTSPSFS